MSENNPTIKDVTENLEKLTKALEASNFTFDLEKAPVLQVRDLSEIANKYLSESAKYDMKQKAKSTSLLINNEFFKCVYFSFRVRSENIENGVRHISSIINKLSQEGLIHSTLAPVSAIDLALITSVRTSAVFCFVLVPETKYKDIEETYKYATCEPGNEPQFLEDLSVPLNDGEFLTTVRVSPVRAMLADDKRSTEELAQDIVKEYLRYLPENTKVLEITQLAITDLSVPFEVKFYNAIMKNIKKVEFDYIRQYVHNGDRGFDVALFSGINYFDKDGKNIKN